MTTEDVCSRIELFLSDVDGVLSDGRMTLDNHGVESKQFHLRDGMGIRFWQRAGGQFGIVTGRESRIVARRAAELDISILHQGDLNKLPIVEKICKDHGLGLDQVCYIGDDLPDLPVIRAVGLGAAVADAVDEVCQAADYVTSKPGGHGAVRELVEYVLKNSGRWEEVVAKYVG